mmetsp:Transcript_44925/g.111852  ORF Transcript_44925/g.111852 Transcript_44925/m.111852 type:complete len:252 (+) Transcript_44925:299-1054(+)
MRRDDLFVRGVASDLARGLERLAEDEVDRPPLRHEAEGASVQRQRDAEPLAEAPQHALRVAPVLRRRDVIQVGGAEGVARDERRAVLHRELDEAGAAGEVHLLHPRARAHLLRLAAGNHLKAAPRGQRARGDALARVDAAGPEDELADEREREEDRRAEREHLAAGQRRVQQPVHREAVVARHAVRVDRDDDGALWRARAERGGDVEPEAEVPPEGDDAPVVLREEAPAGAVREVGAGEELRVGGVEQRGG